MTYTAMLKGLKFYNKDIAVMAIASKTFMTITIQSSKTVRSLVCTAIQIAMYPCHDQCWEYIAYYLLM